MGLTKMHKNNFLINIYIFFCFVFINILKQAKLCTSLRLPNASKITFVYFPAGIFLKHKLNIFGYINTGIIFIPAPLLKSIIQIASGIINYRYLYIKINKNKTSHSILLVSLFIFG